MSPRRAGAGLDLWALRLTPLLLAGLLGYLDTLTLHSIRHEEVVESVRNVYWFDQGLVYDGVYTNIGWYGTLLAAYKVFGFSLATAKYVRLALYLAGLYAAAALMVRYMRPRTAMVPLLLIGLSPTVLYFSTTQISCGVDMPYAAMCLWLMLSGRAGSTAARDLAFTFGAGLVAMVAAMSYPAFVLYLPSLALVFLWHSRQVGSTARAGLGRSLAAHVGAAATGFALPLAAAFMYVTTRHLLLYDPATDAGMFRSGGRLGADPSAFWQAVVAVGTDLFVAGRSYYYDVTRPDFSGVLAPIGLLVSLGTFVYLALSRRIDGMLAAAVGLAVVMGLVVPSLGVDGEPGIRRATILLAATFAAFTMTWRWLAAPHASAPRWRRAAMAGCALLPLAFALKVPALAEDLEGPNRFQNRDWFAAAATPADALARVVTGLDQGQQLACPLDPEGKVTPCRYQEIYAAVAGYREWNGLAAKDIHALDWRTGRDIVLSTTLWRDGYYPTCSRKDVCQRDMNAIFAAMRQEGGAPDR